MDIDLPHLDDQALAALAGAGVPGSLRALARRVDRAGDEVDAVAGAVRRCADLEWESGAADLYEREVDAALTELVVTGGDLTTLAHGLDSLATTVEHRLERLSALRLPVIGLLP